MVCSLPRSVPRRRTAERSFSTLFHSFFRRHLRDLDLSSAAPRRRDLRFSGEDSEDRPSPRLPLRGMWETDLRNHLPRTDLKFQARTTENERWRTDKDRERGHQLASRPKHKQGDFHQLVLSSLRLRRLLTCTLPQSRSCHDDQHVTSIEHEEKL